MKVKNFGHCCLLIEENNVRILTDPGIYSIGQDEVKNIDAILITHEHPDHIHIPSLKNCLTNNPNVKIFTNKGVGKMLDAENIHYSLLEEGQNVKIKEILIEAEGHDHFPLYKPSKQVEILALPVAGPWLKLSEAIDYALAVKPKIVFPVHEGILKQPGVTRRIPPTILESAGIKFVVIEEGKEVEF